MARVHEREVVQGSVLQCQVMKVMGSFAFKFLSRQTKTVAKGCINLGCTLSPELHGNDVCVSIHPRQHLGNGPPRKFLTMHITPSFKADIPLCFISGTLAFFPLVRSITFKAL